MKVLFLFALIVLVSGQCTQKDADGNVIEPAEVKDLERCSWYSKETCCHLPGDVSYVKEEHVRIDDGCTKLPDSCSQKVELIKCIECSPEHASYLDDQGRVKVCKGFWDSVIDSCLKLEVCPPKEENGRTVEQNCHEDDRLCEAVFEEGNEVEPAPLACTEDGAECPPPQICYQNYCRYIDDRSPNYIWPNAYVLAAEDEENCFNAGSYAVPCVLAVFATVAALAF